MSFQAYLDALEQKTGHTPRELVAQAHERGLDAPGTKAGAVVTWLADEYGVGRGHAMALVHVLKNGATISRKHVGSTGSHRDGSDTLWLDGVATKPAG
jgi:hypothetical protein